MFRFTLAILTLASSISLAKPVSFETLTQKLNQTRAEISKHPKDASLTERQCRILKQMNDTDFDRALKITGGFQHEIDYCF